MNLTMNTLRWFSVVWVCTLTLQVSTGNCSSGDNIEKTISLKNGEAVVIKSSPAFSVIVAAVNGIETILVLQNARPTFSIQHENGILAATQNVYHGSKEEIITFKGNPLLPVSKMTVNSDKSGYIEQFTGGVWAKKVKSGH